MNNLELFTELVAEALQRMSEKDERVTKIPIPGTVAIGLDHKGKLIPPQPLSCYLVSDPLLCKAIEKLFGELGMRHKRDYNLDDFFKDN